MLALPTVISFMLTIFYDYNSYYAGTFFDANRTLFYANFTFFDANITFFYSNITFIYANI